MTLVHAPMERCFRLSLSAELHRDATHDTALAGIDTGLLGPDRQITWETRKLGWKFRREILIEAWRPFAYFREVMVEGTLRAWEHEHHFAPMNDGTRIRDEIRFTAPMGPFGRLSERFLRRRLTAHLALRNAFIKRVAESEEWHRYLDGQPELDTRVFQSLPESPGTAGKAYAG